MLDGPLRCFRGGGLGVLLALTSHSAQAQSQTYQTWPEIDTCINLHHNFRLHLIAAQMIEHNEGTDAEIGPDLARISHGEWAESKGREKKE